MSTKHISAFLKSQSSRARRPLNLSIVLSFGAGIVLIIQMGILAFCVDSVLTHKASLTDLLFLLPPLVILFFTRAILSYFFRATGAEGGHRSQTCRAWRSATPPHRQGANP